MFRSNQENETGNKQYFSYTIIIALHMKYIIVQWMPEDSPYKKAMYVIASNHPRFSIGTRFDFGFFQIANDEGYVITSYPLNKELHSIHS